MSIELIPCFNAADLPEDVEEELKAFEASHYLNLCFHGDDGCVFSVYPGDVDKLQLFLRWLASNKMITLPLAFYHPCEFSEKYPADVYLPAGKNAEVDAWTERHAEWEKKQRAQGKRYCFQFAMTGT